MKTKMTLLLLLISAAIIGSAQVTLGTIKGQVFDKEEGKSIPNAAIFLEGQGYETKLRADLDGKFTFNALKPGIYNVEVYSIGKDTMRIKKIEVKPEAITNIGKIELVPNSKTLGKVEIVYTKPLIRKDVQKIEIGIEDIKHSPNIQNPKELFASMNSDVIIQEGSNDVIIRGSRPGDAVYFIDGVKANDLNGVPGVGIGSMTGYTGGIPAKYGDTTGGVIILETKSYFDLYYAWMATQ